MLCQVCNKNDATLHYTKIINGEIEKLHLCEACSKGNDEFDFDKTFSFHNLLTEIIDGVQDNKINNKQEELHCKKCKLNYSEFKQLGKLGCDECYDSFQEKLFPLIKSVQGSEKHIGKIPSRASECLKREREIEKLREKLDKYVLDENFEEAAVMRDKIRELEE